MVAHSPTLATVTPIVSFTPFVSPPVPIAVAVLYVAAASIGVITQSDQTTL